MAIEITVLIAVIGCFVTLAGWLASREKKISADSEWRGKVDTKLDILLGLRDDVSALKGEVRADVMAVREDMGVAIDKVDVKVDRLTERMAGVEASAKSMHHRLDGIEEKRG